MTYQTIILEQDSSVATLTINRPDVLNAMNQQFWIEFEQAIDSLSKDDNAHVILLTGAGRAFSAGADLKESKARSAEDYQRYIYKLQEISLKFINFPKPTIAAINGYAIGSGYELALACDIRLISTEAKIGSPEAKISTAVTGGASALVQQLIGPARAKELLFTGDFIDAVTAHEIGLANYIVEPSELVPRSLELAKKIAENSPLSLRLIKEGLQLAANGCPLSELMDFEAEACLKAVATEDRSTALEEFEDRKK